MPAARSARAMPGAPPLGSIVVHALPDDYGNLPFISSRNPYVELLAASRSPAARRTHRPRRRVRGLRMEPRAALLGCRDGVAASRRGVRARRGLARRGLGAAGARAAALRRLPPQRSRRHLRARLSGDRAARSSGQPGRSHGAGGARLRAAAPGQRHFQGAQSPRAWRLGAAARAAGELLSKAVPRVRRGGLRAGGGAGAGHAQLRRRADGGQHRAGGHPHRVGRRAVSSKTWPPRAPSNWGLVSTTT